MTLTVKNFKKFSTVLLPLGEKNILIKGSTDSGKTQILWAYIFYFKARSYHFTDKDTFISLHDDVHLLLDSSFVSLPSWTSFIHRLDDCEHQGVATFKGKFDHEERDSTIILKANGVLKLSTETSSCNIPKKIAFAHMGIMYKFSTKRDRSPYITSFDQSLRYKYNLLPDTSKQQIIIIMQSFFKNLKDIREENNPRNPLEIFIYCYLKREEYNEEDEEYSEEIEDGNSDEESEFESEKAGCKRENKTEIDDLIKLEIIYQSSSYQKLFATLILFFTLSNYEEDSLDAKYYLIDEPEVVVETTLLKTYFSKLTELAKKEKINLIIASNSTEIESLAKKSEFTVKDLDRKKRKKNLNNH